MEMYYSVRYGKWVACRSDQYIQSFFFIQADVTYAEVSSDKVAADIRLA
jgi:hypothetical protein